METVELDDDVYEFIAKNTQVIGESASSILRRLLNLRATEDLSVPKVRDLGQHELSEILAQPTFRTRTTAVDRMLSVLSGVYTQRKADFEKVLSIRGRNRAYFAKTRQEIAKTGKSTQPREIPGSGYWVMTNSQTPQKQQLVADALHVLGYSEAAVQAAIAVIQ